jgi:hypothetical protein
MSQNPHHILAEIIALAGSLPDEPAAYANLTGAKRRALRAELGKAVDRLNQLSERSPWDTLHPGRDWATGGNNTPNRRSVDKIRADIAEHFRKYPIKELS